MEFLHYLSQNRSDLGNIFFQFVTYFGQEAVVIFIVCWLFWCANKRLAYLLGFNYLLSGVLVQGLKITFRIPRPWILDPDFKVVPSALADATGYSFPSGHTQSATALFGTFGLSSSKTRTRILAFLAIFLIGFSRMYLGCHTPKDVIVSFLISISIVFVCYHIFYLRTDSEKYIHTIAIGAVIFSVMLAIYAFVLFHTGSIAIEYAQDCLKASGAGTAFGIGYYVEKKYINFRLPNTLRNKITRFIFGLIVALLLQSGLKPIIGVSLPACFFRYFITLIWILVIYPLIFTSNKYFFKEKPL